MPRRKSQGTPPIKRNSSSKEQLLNTFQEPLRILDDNNDKQVQENGLDGYKMVKENDSSNRYLHKKFKKIATLEDTSPKKEKGVLYAIPSEESDEAKPTSDGRYVCPYCKLSWSKPSVLQKHIRAHTNERPFPCLPCGFAFKTKSNLYKHCRSRAHTLKIDGQSSEDDDGGSPSSELSNKPYKPKFHLPETSVSSASTCSSPFSSSPSPDLLNAHINKLITENQAMIFDTDWASTIKREETPSPPRNGDVALMLAQYQPVPMSHEPEDLSSTSTTSEPLNLTVKEPRKRGISEASSCILSPPKESIMKDLLIRHKEIPDLTRITEEVLYPCPHCKVVFRTSDNLNTHLFSCKPKSSPGPLLGKTPLIDTFVKDNIKKRKVDFSKFECAKSSLKLFGGEVKILDTTDNRTLRLDLNKECAKKDAQVLTFAKTGLNAVGGTMVQSETKESKNAYPEKLVLPSVATPTLKVPGISTPVQVPQLRFPPSLNPLTSITAFNPLTLPHPASLSKLSPLKASPTPYNGGVGTILHAGKAIPFVPGMPGPNTLLASPPPLVPYQEQSVIIRSPLPPLPKESVKPLPSPVIHEPPTPPAVIAKTEELKEVIKRSSEGQERKFLRPSSLPLKPGTYTPKKQLNTPLHSTSLISPETPRPRKSYGQLYLNGHAYTYLGLKCSTRMFFCTLNKPQPIYVPLAPDQYKVSMYSNWTICSDASPTPPGIDTRKAMSSYDSRNRNSSYTSANRSKQDIITHSSYKSAPIESEKSPLSANSTLKTDESDVSADKMQVCEGGFESNEEYTYVRGRGRGRYVCKECGIRCKKPSMLKKHIRTHTDLRPYTCKYCAFSFKTKGNLTKHMKSKAHYKRCIELDIIPVPTTIDSCYIDDECSRSQGDWGSKDDLGGNDDESDETDEDEDEDEDESEDEGYEGDECRMEREAAKSLLTLSEVTLETAHRQYVSAGLVSSCSKPRTYPYSLSPHQVEPVSIERAAKVDMWRSDVLSLTKDCQDLDITVRLTPSSEPAESTRPMDLSNKSTALFQGGPKTPVITSVGGQAHLLASICSTTEKLPTTPTTEYPEDSKLLHKYLTAVTVRDQQIKLQQQRKRLQELPVERLLEPEPSKTTLPQPQPQEEEIKKVEEPIAEERILVPRSEPPTSSVMSLKRADSPPSQISPSSPGNKKQAEFREPASALSYISSTEDGKSMCSVCNKVFNKPSQLRLHVNIHYFERPFRCESCAVSFRTKGHLQKHLRSLSHLNKVNMNSTFGTATTSNPRPFKCDDCKIAFRIHGHLAKHFRSKMHIMKLECLGKLPFGTYAELERSGINMNDIDTTDCENSLESLQVLAQKLCLDKDPLKPDHWGDSGDHSRDMMGGSASEDEAGERIDVGRSSDCEETVR
uniref:Zinc finger protein 40 n=1 Tax=Lygus hesperus TaxID=30085 RepID=A0A0A9WCW1_LYGHE